YNAGMGADGHLALTRLSLRDGQVAKDNGSRQIGAWITTVVHGTTFGYGRNGIVLPGPRAEKAPVSWAQEKEALPIASSHALAKSHLVATTLRGEVIVLDLEAKPGAKPFRFQTPNGKGIGSSPAISGGSVFFGCDDGYFYVLGPQGNLKPT